NAGVLGTVDFIAPEQAMDGHNVDARADVYSLGCTLYFLLCGQAPFPEGSIAQRLMCHVSRKPKAIESFRDDVPEDLIEICDRMMAKKPEDRFQNADQVRLALLLHLQDSDGKTLPHFDETEATPTDVETPHLATSHSAASLAPDPSGSTNPISDLQQSTLPSSLAAPLPARLPPGEIYTAQRLHSTKGDALGLSAESLSSTPEDWSSLAIPAPSNATIPGGPTGSSLDLHGDSLGLSTEDLTDAPIGSTSSINLPASAIPGLLADRRTPSAPNGGVSQSRSASPFPPSSSGSAKASASRPGDSTFGDGSDGSSASGDDPFAPLPPGTAGISSLMEDFSAGSLSAPGAPSEPSSLSLTRPPTSGRSLSSFMVQVICPKCRARLAVAGSAANQAITCPKCGRPTK
ncbi:MAG TPA: hypothetical protein VGE52_18840, partial [Pirellulales bacterium]